MNVQLQCKQKSVHHCTCTWSRCVGSPVLRPLNRLITSASFRPPKRLKSLPSSYGFSVAGALFWVRRVRAAVIGLPYDDDGAHVLCSTTSSSVLVGTTGRRRVQQVQQDHDVELCVFVGSGAATEAARNCPENSPSVAVCRLPIGPAPVSGWWTEWPHGGAPRHQIGPAADRTSPKRTPDDEKGGALLSNWDSTTAGIEDNNMNDYRPSKRHCTTTP
jgi:hypothetical protein